MRVRIAAVALALLTSVFVGCGCALVVLSQSPTVATVGDVDVMVQVIEAGEAQCLAEGRVMACVEGSTGTTVVVNGSGLSAGWFSLGAALVKFWPF